MPELHTLYALHSQSCALVASIYAAMFAGQPSDQPEGLHDAMTAANKASTVLYALIADAKSCQCGGSKYIDVNDTRVPCGECNYQS